MKINNDKAEENGASILIGDGMDSGGFGEEAACDLGLKKDYSQWQLGARRSRWRETGRPDSLGCAGSSSARSKGAWKKQTNLDPGADSASSLTSLGLGQVT